MTELRVVLRRNLVILATYFALIILLVISERLVGASIAETWIFIIGSVSYALFVIRNHWLAGASREVKARSLQFAAICFLFVVGGLFVGIVVGVNLKFLMGLSL